jgi:biopolymer transport protein ExbD
MSYAPPPRRSSFGVVFLCVVLFGFAMLFVMVLGGFLVFGFARAERQAQQAVVAEELARAQAVRARAMVDMARAKLEPRDMVVQGEPEVSAAEVGTALAADPEAMSQAATASTAAGSDTPSQSIRVAQREVTVSLNAEGQIQVDGSNCELPQLKEVLSQAIKGREEALRLAVQVDKQCAFEHLSAVLAVCRELDVRDVRIAALDQ